MTKKKEKSTDRRETALSKHLGKLPPQAVEIEETVLGALMLERDRINHVLGFLQPEDFYKDAHQNIFKSIINLFSKDEPVDIKTVTHELREAGTLEVVGGAHYVAGLTTKVNSAANIQSHSKIVKEQALKRALISLSSEIQHDAYEDTEDVFELIERVDLALYKLSATLSSSDFVHLGSLDIVNQLVDQITSAKEAYENNDLVGVPCGFTAIDRITGGFRPSELIIIAARPAMGKSAMVASIMKNCGEFKKSVAMFSLEMNWTEVGVRMIAMQSEVMLENLRNGKISEHQLNQV
ncbi:MAG: DnaB-like helicase N-terminal domain-containing protein, partial [Ekhidna sp.]